MNMTVIPVSITSRVGKKKKRAPARVLYKPIALTFILFQYGDTVRLYGGERLFYCKEFTTEDG